MNQYGKDCLSSAPIFTEHDPEIPVALILTFVPVFIVTVDVMRVIRPGIWCASMSDCRAVSNLIASFELSFVSVVIVFKKHRWQ